LSVTIQQYLYNQSAKYGEKASVVLQVLHTNTLGTFRAITRPNDDHHK
jgi:hypothetical protein